MAHPDSVSPLKPNPYLEHRDPWRWDIRSQVFLRAGKLVKFNGEYREERTGSWDVEDIEFVYPIARQGGHYWSPNEEITATLRIGDVKFTPDAKILQTPDSSAPYIWWRSEHKYRWVHQLHMTQVSHVVSADTRFNEQLAKEIPWPKSWPAEASAYLTPIIDQINDPVDTKGQDRLIELVDQWLEGNDPKSIDEVTLAKYLTGKVLDYVRVTRSNTFLAPAVHTITAGDILDGLSVFPSSAWSGYLVRSADQVALKPAGSGLDTSTMLTAVLRAAGVPARLVVCYKTDEFGHIDERVVALVEFALYDAKRDQILWIPIDPELLRDNGRRSSNYQQRWDYFGNHDQLRNYAPISHYFHPPVNYKAFGNPGLYGIKTTPDIGKHVYQVISIDVVNSAIRGDEINQRP